MGGVDGPHSKRTGFLLHISSKVSGNKSRRGVFKLVVTWSEWVITALFSRNILCCLTSDLWEKIPEWETFVTFPRHLLIAR